MSSDLLNIFKKRFEIITGDLFDFDFGLDKNSLIICNKLLHFFNDKTKFELIEKFYSSLENGGLLYLKINHFKHPNNTDLTKVTKIDDTTYQNKEVPEDVRYLIVPEKFLFTLKKSYNLLTNYVLQDNKFFEVVIRK